MRPTVAVYEGMDVVQAPKDISGKNNSVSAVPVSVHHVDEVVHQRGDAIMIRGMMVTDRHRARAILPGISMKASYGLEVERLNDVLR